MMIDQSEETKVGMSGNVACIVLRGGQRARLVRRTLVVHACSFRVGAIEFGRENLVPLPEQLFEIGQVAYVIDHVRLPRARRTERMHVDLHRAINRVVLFGDGLEFAVAVLRDVPSFQVEDHDAVRTNNRAWRVMIACPV